MGQVYGGCQVGAAGADSVRWEEAVGAGVTSVYSGPGRVLANDSSCIWHASLFSLFSSLSSFSQACQ